MRSAGISGPRSGVRTSTCLGVLAAAVIVVVMGTQMPVQAAAAGNSANAATTTISKATTRPAASNTVTPGSQDDVKRMCGIPKAGDFTCFALQRTNVAPRKGLLREAVAAPTGYGPSDLQSAYNLPAGGGEGQTVALVDAYEDPYAEADLALYRQQYGLPVCTTANGCFTKVDQHGGSDYPPVNDGWVGEISLDLDMVSAVAPKAHILLVEADDSSSVNLSAAEDEAVALGAKYVSNSWGSPYAFLPEDPAETSLDPHFDHAGVAIVASVGRRRLRSLLSRRVAVRDVRWRHLPGPRLRQRARLVGIGVERWYRRRRHRFGLFGL